MNGQRSSDHGGLARQRSEEASRLVADNLGLAMTTAKTMFSRGGLYFDSDDMKQTAMLGLVQAARRYDPRHGVKFSTFAIPRIRGAVLDGLRASDWVPRGVREKSSVDDFIPTMQHFHAASPAENDEHCGEFLADTRAEEPGDVAAKEELKSRLAGAMLELPRQQRAVIMLRYYAGLRTKEIAKVLGVTDGRVSQIHRAAVTALRATLDPDAAPQEN